MRGNIRTLYKFDPLATDEEIHAAALQFVRKLSGPSKANEGIFHKAVEDVMLVARRLVDRRQTSAPAKNREREAAKAKATVIKRFG